jgi:hypothetical protein
MVYQESDRFQFPNETWDWIMPLNFGNFVYVRSHDGLYGVMQGLPDEDKVIIPPQCNYLVGIVINAPCFLITEGNKPYKYSKVLDRQGNEVNLEEYEQLCGVSPPYFYTLVDVVTSGNDVEKYIFECYDAHLKKSKKEKKPYIRIYSPTS